VLVISIVIDSIRHQRIENAVVQILEWVKNDPITGILAVILVYTIGTIIFVPGSVLTIGSGYAFSRAFGLGKGVALSSVVSLNLDVI